MRDTCTTEINTVVRHAQGLSAEKRKALLRSSTGLKSRMQSWGLRSIVYRAPLNMLERKNRILPPEKLVGGKTWACRSVGASTHAQAEPFPLALMILARWQDYDSTTVLGDWVQRKYLACLISPDSRGLHEAAELRRSTIAHRASMRCYRDTVPVGWVPAFCSTSLVRCARLEPDSVSGCTSHLQRTWKWITQQRVSPDQFCQSLRGCSKFCVPLMPFPQAGRQSCGSQNKQAALRRDLIGTRQIFNLPGGFAANHSLTPLNLDCTDTNILLRLVDEE
jgi:hypothetical protein